MQMDIFHLPCAKLNRLIHSHKRPSDVDFGLLRSSCTGAHAAVGSLLPMIRVIGASQAGDAEIRLQNY